MIASASSSKPQLSFTGFICPLKSYSPSPVSTVCASTRCPGCAKLHAGDFLPRRPHLCSSQRLCTGGRLVHRRLRQLCHHLPRQNDRWQRLHHLVWTYEVHCHDGGQICQAGARLIGYVGTTGNSTTGNHLHLECGRQLQGKTPSIHAQRGPHPLRGPAGRHILYFWGFRHEGR